MSRQTPIPRVPSALPGVPCVLCVVPFDATHEGGISNAALAARPSTEQKMRME